MAAVVIIWVATMPPFRIGIATIVSSYPIRGTRAKPATVSESIERTAVATVRHSARSSRRLMVVPMLKTMKQVAHLPISERPATLMMSGGMMPVTKPIRKRKRLTKTEESLALVATPSTAPIPKNRRQIKRKKYVFSNIRTPL